jgi:nitroimidazol reductase NimA-like FMN-containing flavoprotein (pyridoxamine 5'-phosphate oxidase superfamily)
VTLLDGLVLARSAFHHSMNYRSVVIFSKARVVSGKQEKLEALRAFTEQIF